MSDYDAKTDATEDYPGLRELAETYGAVPKFHYRPEYKRDAAVAAAETDTELAADYANPDPLKRHAAIRERTARDVAIAKSEGRHD